MAYQVAITEERGIVRAEVSGKRDARDSLALWQRLAEECRTRGASAALAVMRLEGRMSTTEMFDLASRLREHGWDPKVPLAIVDTNEPSQSDNEFGATVAANRGLAVRAFTDVRSAEAWLADR